MCTRIRTDAQGPLWKVQPRLLYRAVGSANLATCVFLRRQETYQDISRLPDSRPFPLMSVTFCTYPYFFSI